MSVALFTLGGTISMAGRSPVSGNGVITRLTGEDLTKAVPGLADVGEPVEIHDVQAVPSAGLTFTQILELVEAASKAVDAGATGVVVTQGTDTLEETAFLVDLVWPHQAPFVLTGAMRNPTLAGPDGPANLLAAAHAATSSEAADLGALVVFNDEIHAARWVRKQHSTSTATFGSPDVGPIGHVIEGRARLLARPLRSKQLPWPDANQVTATRVALYTVSFDDDALLLRDVGATHHGLVIGGFGAGHVPSAMAAELGALASKLPVVLTSRTGSGPVLRNTYGAVGSEVDLQQRGLVNGGRLDPYKARVLLRLLVAHGADRAQVEEAFDKYG
jgi:L-asparaginase